jgi:hypothetical protein
MKKTNQQGADLSNGLVRLYVKMHRNEHITSISEASAMPGFKPDDYFYTNYLAPLIP